MHKFLAASLALMLAAAPVWAEPPAHAKEKKTKTVTTTVERSQRIETAGDPIEKSLIRLFSAAERSIITGYFRDYTLDGQPRSKGLPPGLAKKDRLPPGLQKQLARNDRLPPGLEKRALPADLLSRLPAGHPGTERLIVGTDVVLVDAATQVVLDILRDVLVPRSDIRWND